MGSHGKKIARLEEKMKASRSALKLARGSLSRNGIITIITIIISIIAIAVHFIK